MTSLTPATMTRPVGGVWWSWLLRGAMDVRGGSVYVNQSHVPIYTLLFRFVPGFILFALQTIELYPLFLSHSYTHSETSPPPSHTHTLFPPTDLPPPPPLLSSLPPHTLVRNTRNFFNVFFTLLYSSFFVTCKYRMGLPTTPPLHRRSPPQSCHRWKRECAFFDDWFSKGINIAGGTRVSGQK